MLDENFIYTVGPIYFGGRQMCLILYSFDLRTARICSGFSLLFDVITFVQDLYFNGKDDLGFSSVGTMSCN